MNNLFLKKLIKKSCLHPEDSKNIIRIFWILSDSRQKHILDHWDEIVSKIKLSREKMEAEKAQIIKDFKEKENKKENKKNLFNKKNDIFN